jgi:hypothetical protein
VTRSPIKRRVMEASRGYGHVDAFYAPHGLNPTLALVANSQTPYSFVEVSRIN